MKPQNGHHVEMTSQGLSLHAPTASVTVDIFTVGTITSVTNPLADAEAASIYDESEWYFWTAKELSAWIEDKLRSRIFMLRGRSIGRSRGDTGGNDNNNDNNDRDNDDENMQSIMDEETEIKIESFMLKFNEHDINGQVLFEIKENDGLKARFAKFMEKESFGFWVLVLKAIDSLEMPSGGINSSIYDNISSAVTDDFTAFGKSTRQEQAKLLRRTSNAC